MQGDVLTEFVTPFKARGSSDGKSREDGKRVRTEAEALPNWARIDRGW